MDGEIQIAVDHQVADIEFYHPKGNSLPKALLNSLSEEIKKAGKNDSIKVIRLKSRGKAFCAGASFDELLAIKNEADAQSFFSGFGTLIEAIKSCPKFVVAQVQGKAVGGGVGIIAACDYVFASDLASIKLSELSIGFGPFVIAPAVIRKIGLSAFSTLTIDSKNWKTAEWAYKQGLFNELVSDLADLELKTTHLCQVLAGYSPEAMSHIKAILWEGFDELEDIHKKRAQLSGALSQSETTQEILSLFMK